MKESECIVFSRQSQTTQDVGTVSVKHPSSTQGKRRWLTFVRFKLENKVLGRSIHIAASGMHCFAINLWAIKGTHPRQRTPSEKKVKRMQTVKTA